MQRKIVLLLLALCFVASLLVFPAWAMPTEGSCGDNGRWQFDSETGTLTISGTGKFEGLYGDANREYRLYNAEVRHIVIQDGITEIGAFSFNGLANAESIWIADSVKKIGMSAFSSCCNVTQLHLGNGITTIESSAFSNLGKLQTLTLPTSVQSIGGEAFSLCGLTSVSIPEGVTVINGGTFRGNEKLTSVSIPVSVVEIKSRAFTDCENLTDVYYDGTQAQWEAINIDYSEGTQGDSSDGSNTALRTATIHYNDNHTHSWDDGAVTKAADCAREGEMTYTCADCGSARVEPIAKTSQHSWDDGAVTKTATCDAEGEKTYTCAVCGGARTESIAKTTQHTWDAGTKNADTTVTYHCTVCAAVKTEGTPVTDTQETTKETTGETTEETTNETTEGTTGAEQTDNATLESLDDNDTENTGVVANKLPNNTVWIVLSFVAAAVLTIGGVIMWLWEHKIIRGPER